MTRLTKDVRESIAALAVAHAFDPKLETLKATEDALGREAYASVIPASESKLVRAVPENWFRMDSCLRFNVGGLTIRLSLLGEGLPVPYKASGEDFGGYHCGNLGVIQPGDLCDRIQTHAQALEDYKAQRRDTRYSVLAMLSGVSTLKRLREVWPEGEQFFKRFEDEPASTLPAVRFEELNAALGLALAA